jgi:metal-responsive CopG/Arc/MetJ family transcriptional regulator
MQTISIRLDDNLIAKIEELRGSEHKSDFYRKLIEHALNTFEHKDLRTDDKVIARDCSAFKAKAESLEELIKSKDLTIQTLENKDKVIVNDCALLQAKNESMENLMNSKDLTIKTLENEVGFLIQDHTRISGQLDRLLMPSKEERKEKGKKWFEFWK